MLIDIFQIDAFSERVFGGNPAAVCLLQQWLPEQLLLKIAQENNLAETAFVVPTPSPERFEIRWFTPEIEMDLCGHATLAAAFVLFSTRPIAAQRLLFESPSGSLPVRQLGDWLELDFPARPPKPAQLPKLIGRGLNLQPNEVYLSRDYVLVYEHEAQVRALSPDPFIFGQFNLDPGGVVVTAPGIEVDFVSRFFTPQASIFEDPVTGSAHCSLVPFWAKRLGKTSLIAHQVSERGGVLQCELSGNRVLIRGRATQYLRGQIMVD